MDDEIVVDDIDENSTVDTQQADDASTPVMPLLYIQQNKVRSGQSSSVNQTLVSPSTQLAAIINPVNNQVIIDSGAQYAWMASSLAQRPDLQGLVSPNVA
ncbi:PREDICTED: uncharacterized protein LOC105560446 isoform X2 [Vollenhovia emeryi]|nr:PREDICTED: uncharacterized protein LOC105560446 isoform X2 [Vollenhovia emeryi]XP_011864988.1 PREDICTED: uncharacterized protein LOC105560446 isoform X2 [Vollenhovia emeryi]XP_011864996.1 PREDICTED: uncharacterized protein LOC105560446 isoform X2 [Vollenhovia emeryi]